MSTNPAIPTQLNTAILFLVFNRPDTTSKVFEAIRKAKPQRLYIGADGARTERIGEQELVTKVRKIAMVVDWPCEVKTLFRDKNIGCKNAVSEAITWFFNFEEEGIILEDDILPDPSFFPYCEALLERYRNDENVAMVSGCNMISERFELDTSYFFSKYSHIWGWATWRRSWNLYDKDMTDWPNWSNNGGLTAISDGSSHFEKYWQEIFHNTYAGAIDTWDYQWNFRCWKYRHLSIIPKRPLVENIGFDERATHTTSAPTSYLKNNKIEGISLPLQHPLSVTLTPRIDNVISKTVYKISFYFKVTQFVKSIPIIGTLLVTLKRHYI